jgi:hypothetical protein
VRNKANSVGGSKEPGACREKSYGELDMHGTPAKQSQLFDCGLRIQKGLRPAARGLQGWLYKQSQLAGAKRATTPRCPVSFRQQTQLPVGGGLGAAWGRGTSGIVQTNPIGRSLKCEV